MEDGQLSSFMKSGIYRFRGANAFFIDPVRVLNRSYTRHKVSPSAYYSRFFDLSEKFEAPAESRKRKREEKKPISLNVREKVAEQRHQEVRPFLLKAHEALLGATELLKLVRNLRPGEFSDEERRGLTQQSCEFSFADLGCVWQAPLYEIVLNYQEGDAFVENKADSEFGFNIIVIDPPWENSSAHQKRRYKTLPNRTFLSLPIKKLTHTAGALVALWVTNREKLRTFVEKELFPAWGVTYMSSLHWLKVKPNGLLIGELDLFHHRPYECLLLGYSGEKEYASNLLRLNDIPDNQVFMSVPGDYSRKPPIGELLVEYVSGTRHVRCIELFSRELLAGWTSWGNEPLLFQASKYFLSREK